VQEKSRIKRNETVQGIVNEKNEVGQSKKTE